jgi:hypothetical protein
MVACATGPMIGRIATYTIAEVVADEFANWSCYDPAAASDVRLQLRRRGDEAPGHYERNFRRAQRGAPARGPLWLVHMFAAPWC